MIANFTIKNRFAPSNATEWYVAVWDVNGILRHAIDGIRMRPIDEAAQFANIDAPLTKIIVNSHGLIFTIQGPFDVHDNDTLIWEYGTSTIFIEPGSMPRASFTVMATNVFGNVDQWYPALHDALGNFQYAADGQAMRPVNEVAPFADILTPVSRIIIQAYIEGKTYGVAEGGPFDVKNGDIIVYDWPTQVFTIGMPKPSKGLLKPLLIGAVALVGVVALVRSRSR